MEEKTMQGQQDVNNPEETIDNQADINSAAENSHTAPESADSATAMLEEQIAGLKSQIEELKDKYLRQMADFDNLRKRAAKERLETIQTAGRDIISALLPILDDSERAARQLETAQDVAALREGLNLVFNKLRSTLQSKGLKAMESVGKEFNAEYHEAITEIPAPAEDMKGKVVDEVEKGYYLNDKIIRFAKVVVGK